MLFLNSSDNFDWISFCVVCIILLYLKIGSAVSALSLVSFRWVTQMKSLKKLCEHNLMQHCIYSFDQNSNRPKALFEFFTTNQSAAAHSLMTTGVSFRFLVFVCIEEVKWKFILCVFALLSHFHSPIAVELEVYSNTIKKSNLWSFFLSFHFISVAQFLPEAQEKQSKKLWLIRNIEIRNWKCCAGQEKNVNINIFARIRKQPDL
jgi:hypothetical protein